MEKRLRKELPGGKFENVSLERSKTMGAIRGKGTRSTEVLFWMALARGQIKGWKVHARSIIGKPDFFFPESQVVAFGMAARNADTFPKPTRPFGRQ